MPKRKMWAISRFEDVRIALRAADVLVSGKGVAANKFMNRQVAPITLTSDGEIHDRRRNVLIQPVMPTPLKASRARLEDEAERKIAALATGETFDAMSKFASHLPVTVVAELVGLNEAGRARMLDWAAATFNALGAMNLRGVISLPKMMRAATFSGSVQAPSFQAAGPHGFSRRPTGRSFRSRKQKPW